MATYLVAYDFIGPNRLRKVTTVCENFWYRKQYTGVFCRLFATDLECMQSRMYDIINLSGDQGHFVPICAKAMKAIESLNRPKETVDLRRNM
jgi:CRISPR/Cas system-associated endoribonuclease Cas2